MSSFQRKTVLLPKYVQDFHCIGSMCEDNCCIGTANIDKDAYLEFNSIKSTQLKNKVKNFILKNPDGKYYNYAKINIKKDQQCPFLNSERKCELHIHLGADSLACTCYTVPKRVNSICGIYEMSCRLLCPEAARVALLNSEIMEFDKIEMDVSSRYFISSDITQKNAEDIQQNWFEIRSTLIDILQYREIDFCDRLAFCGFFIKRLDDVNIKNGNARNIPGLIENYAYIYRNTEMLSRIVEIKSASDDIISRFLKIFDTLIQNTGSSNGAKFQEMVLHFIDGSGYKEGNSYGSVIQNLREASELYYQPYMKNRQYILENYFVNLIFQKMFPLRNMKSIFAEFFIYSFYYFAMKCLLIGISSYHKKLDDNLTISLIHNLSRIIDCRTDIESLLNKIFINENLISIENFISLSKY